ncbi:uncharacterized protein F4822DRAFT_250 [Hypoxylon trugodes]|uniref:uncharacterized protein n=1 Tax=Hypoxylon trugodes TaxID=326681 RepID=UPI002190B950|nr:uncharacterized protein F4822DRAFT_250 [Hypoxylon trugodes]KAI1393100.1 hypothetical protein F4822DRAFT_250 [Hypoxylon trugodes]
MVTYISRDNNLNDGRIIVSGSNLNPILQMISWLLMSIMSLMLCFRQLTRCFIKAGIPFSWEDLLVLISFN